MPSTKTLRACSGGSTMAAPTAVTMPTVAAAGSRRRARAP